MLNLSQQYYPNKNNFNADALSVPLPDIESQKSDLISQKSQKTDEN